MSFAYTSLGGAGVSGYSGLSGWSGWSGWSGNNGIPGTSGYSGYSGVSGFSGASGKSGFSGASGAQPAIPLASLQNVMDVSNTTSDSFIMSNSQPFYDSSGNSYVLLTSGTWQFLKPVQAVSGFSGAGSLLTALNASNLTTGTVGTARLGTGSANSSNFLRGDGTWNSPPLQSIPTPGGTTGSVQYNSLSNFAGNNNFTYDGTNLVVAGGTISANKYVNASTALTSGTTIAWNAAISLATLTLGTNATLSNPTNLTTGTYVLKVTQDGTGSRTLAYGTSYKWPGGVAPTLSTAAGAVDILTFVSDGTNMYGSVLKAFA